MPENRRAIETRNEYLQSFNALKKAELDSMQNIILSVGLPGLLIFYTVRTLIDKLTIEGSYERAYTKMYVYSGLCLFMILWLIFAYRWLNYLYTERKLMDSGEHQMQNCDGDKFLQNLDSLDKSIDSLNKKWIAVYILYGTVIVLQCIFALLRIRDLYLERSKFH